MTPALRKLALTAHVTCSVGWLGAVAGFLALALTGLHSDDTESARAAYLAMETIGRLVLAPLAVVTLVTGLVQSLGTAWGLFRHYWVVFKLLITVVATTILLLYLQTLGRLADIAEASAARGGDLTGLRTASPVLHAAGALVLLLATVVLAIYKPRGLTPYGWRKQQQRCEGHSPGSSTTYKM